MSVTTSLDTFRARSRLTARAVSDKNVRVSEFEVQEVAETGGQVTQTFLVKNNALAIINDPDQCQPGVTGAVGYNVRGRALDPDGNALASVTECVAYSGSTLTDPTRQYTFDHPVPNEPGSYIYEYEFDFPASGRSIGTIPIGITVEDNADTGSGSTDDDGGNGDDGDGDGGLFQQLGLGDLGKQIENFIQNAGIGALIAFAIVALAATAI